MLPGRLFFHPCCAWFLTTTVAAQLPALCLGGSSHQVIQQAESVAADAARASPLLLVAQLAADANTNIKRGGCRCSACRAPRWLRGPRAAACSSLPTAWHCRCTAVAGITPACTNAPLVVMAVLLLLLLLLQMLLQVLAVIVIFVTVKVIVIIRRHHCSWVRILWQQRTWVWLPMPIAAAATATTGTSTATATAGAAAVAIAACALGQDVPHLCLQPAQQQQQQMGMFSCTGMVVWAGGWGNWGGG
jgi:hypothetical protein